ncbi:hypothetical protein L3Q82_005942 [Scortum barcoo]|uniref:Uncharacterized protein n=1 Tax=Scortum barcoo TaxID=214431 RepID=A0ACB8X2C4_9TELE|nr:hypothetical protein L3Q82_005942 [Scortum barcoo]
MEPWLRGVSCEDLTPVKKEEFSSEGSTVTLSYKYSKKATVDNYFFWYRQYPGKPPDFLVFHLGTQNETKPRLSVKADPRCSQFLNTADMTPLFISLLLAAMCLECRAQKDNVLQPKGDVTVTEGEEVTLPYLAASSTRLVRAVSSCGGLSPWKTPDPDPTGCGLTGLPLREKAPAAGGRRSLTLPSIQRGEQPSIVSPHLPTRARRSDGTQTSDLGENSIASNQIVERRTLPARKNSDDPASSHSDSHPSTNNNNNDDERLDLILQTLRKPLLFCVCSYQRISRNFAVWPSISSGVVLTLHH